MEEKIKEILETKIRPLLQRDGGDIEFVRVENNNVLVRLTGACHGCPAAQMTLQMGVQRLLKQEIPELNAVIAV